MNRKIFTLLACALMLFSTAFTINAKVVGGNLAVGDTVRTLPNGQSTGMYHLRIDSIYVEVTPGVYEWQGVHGAATAPVLNYLFPNEGISEADTVIVAVTESGQVIPVSANDLRHDNSEDITYTDLQAAMWCINIEDIHENGNMPTFHFTNNVFGMDLDFANQGGDGYVGGTNQGWMFSPSYDNGLLENSMPLRRFKDSKNYRVLVYQNGVIKAIDALIEDFTKKNIPGLLKFSIVEVAPVVLDADAFNTKLGATDGTELTQLLFNPEPTSEKFPNYFGEKLKAENGDHNGYLNLYVNGSSNVIYNIVNDPNDDNDNRYTNGLGVKHLRILADGKNTAIDNDEYRFVYFPSHDSLVINAYEVSHWGNNGIDNGNYWDDGAYTTDAPGVAPLYYGLYTEEIHDRLIVRMQDLYGLDQGSSLMTIGILPANTRISFGVNTCRVDLDAWTPAEGIYTIWDDRGRMLGVRPYNGALVAQWIELRLGECPDRIPSYQWVIEKADENTASPRVNIYNREFGNINNDYVQMLNILIKEGSSMIFQNQGQFLYPPFREEEDAYETIVYGEVTGTYLSVADPASCAIESASGFRPVNNAYVSDQYLGYKHFYVDTDPSSVSFGKSEDVVGMGDMTEKGMDYNAFAFNYLHEYSEKGYIDLKENKNDQILYVNTEGKEGFQFRLGTKLRKAGLNFETEKYGYPEANAYPADGTIDYNPNGHEQNAPRLERYYYELKVADFYNYRDDLAEQFVVLKGADDLGTDIANKFNYGVADVYADEDPFKYANVYLRETYFLEREKTVNEERKVQDPSRRTFYALIDRIEEEQFDRLADMGYEILDTLKGEDGSSPYGMLMLNVDDHTGIIRGVTKSIASTVMSTFALENMNYPLYRRLASKEDDGAVNNGGTMPYDAPKTLRIYKQENQRLYLYEDATSAVSDNLGINFLGQANIDQFPEDVAKADGSYYNYNLFVDTAYINRGTGWIKPQYLIAVDPQIVDEPVTITYMDACNEEVSKELKPYIRARYLINATDSARQIGSTGKSGDPVRDGRYIIYTSWDRLAFVDAIHVDDRLYIVSELQKAGIPESSYLAQSKEDGQWYVDADSLVYLAEAGRIQARTPFNSDEYGTFYDFEEWQNYHNDVSFSLRFVNDYAQNPDEATGEGGTDNDSKAFMIESETTNRAPYGNAKIAPVQGGWIKMQNGVPVLTRGYYGDAIEQAEIFNVEIGTGEATANDLVSSEAAVKVISGTDEITVLNANGKQVTVTNLLGQTIADMVSNSDNVTVKAPKGIVIVTVEGEQAVKSIVK